MIDKNKTLQQLNLIFQTVFENERLEIDENSNTNNVENWDSLKHIELIINIEEEFNFKFSATDIQKINDVKSIINVILSKKEWK